MDTKTTYEIILRNHLQTWRWWARRNGRLIDRGETPDERSAFSRALLVIAAVSPMRDEFAQKLGIPETTLSTNLDGK